MLDVPTDDWRWAVANWHHERWLVWRRRVTAILAEDDAATGSEVAPADPEEIREYCRGRIATYKIPRYVKFVDGFPMTETGKIQKFKMREQAIEELGLAGAATVTTA